MKAVGVLAMLALWYCAVLQIDALMQEPIAVRTVKTVEIVP